MEQEFVAAARFVKEYLEKTERPEMGKRSTAGFRWRHMLRVLNNARIIGKAEGADMDVLEMAVLLHDVAKLDPRSETTHHAVLGSEVAERYLRQAGLPSDYSHKVVEAVRYHAYDTYKDDLSLETLVLKDSDRLDEVGALGVIWVGIHAGRIGMDYRGCFGRAARDLHSLQELHLYTETGREMFTKRLKIMNEFWLQVEEELTGESLEPYSDF
ncbi:MAG: HD domain-containing protein [Firmicutes bacterium]|nr:HD domain-containing protein [Bacillota bacterium]